MEVSWNIQRSRLMRSEPKYTEESAHESEPEVEEPEEPGKTGAEES